METKQNGIVNVSRLINAFDRGVCVLVALVEWNAPEEIREMHIASLFDIRTNIISLLRNADGLYQERTLFAEAVIKLDKWFDKHDELMRNN